MGSSASSPLVHYACEFPLSYVGSFEKASQIFSYDLLAPGAKGYKLETEETQEKDD